MNTNRHSEALTTMMSAARAGGAVLMKHFGSELAVKEKSSVSDFQTNADTESEDAIAALLQKSLPSYGIRGEERGPQNNSSNFVFLIDPLDGTNNFVLGIPYFSVSIALLQDDTALAAVVYEPTQDRMYRASRGQGAFLVSARLRVSKCADITRATATTMVPYVHDKKRHHALTTRLYIEKGAKRTLNTWSPSLDFCLLASGRIDAAFALGIETYDCVPGKLIMREAGAVIADLEGRPDTSDMNSSFVAASTPELLDEAVSISRNALKEQEEKKKDLV